MNSHQSFERVVSDYKKKFDEWQERKIQLLEELDKTQTPQEKKRIRSMLETHQGGAGISLAPHCKSYTRLLSAAFAALRPLGQLP